MVFSVGKKRVGVLILSHCFSNSRPEWTWQTVTFFKWSPQKDIKSHIEFCILSGILSDTFFIILSDILSSMLSGILPDTYFGILCGILFGILSDKYSKYTDMQFGSLADILSIWHIFWHSVWHSIWYSAYYLFFYPVLHCFWHVCLLSP